MTRVMALYPPFSYRAAAAVVLPLALVSLPAAAQSGVKEDSVVLQPDKVTDDAPTIASEAEQSLPDWSKDNARALLAFIQDTARAQQAS